METIQESRLLITHVLHSTIIDYLYEYKNSSKYTYKTAKDFLFNDSYLIDWGELILSPKELLDHIDIDLEYIRDKIRSKQQDPNFDNTKYIKGNSLL